MKAVILAAGEGLRMRPLTDTKPKPMLEILGRPLLWYVFESLPDEITDVAVVVGYLENHIREYLGKRFAGRTVHFIHQEGKFGTAHALNLCRDFLAGERFLLLYADDLQSKTDIQKCLKYPVSILVKEVEDPRRFGVIVADKSGRVLELVEKPEIPPSNLASTGVTVLDARVFDYPAIPHANGEFYITDSIAQMAKERPVMAVLASFWLPIGYPGDLKKAEEILKTKNAGS